MIQETSQWAYARAVQNLGAKQKEVLDALRYFPDATNAEIAVRLGWPVNRITPRILELRKMELVFDAGRRRCKVTGSTAHCWKAKHPVLPEAFTNRAAHGSAAAERQADDMLLILFCNRREAQDGPLVLQEKVPDEIVFVQTLHDDDDATRGLKVPLLSGASEKRTAEDEIISSERGSLVEVLCRYSP